MAKVNTFFLMITESSMFKGKTKEVGELPIEVAGIKTLQEDKSRIKFQDKSSKRK